MLTQPQISRIARLVYVGSTGSPAKNLQLHQQRRDGAACSPQLPPELAAFVFGSAQKSAPSLKRSASSSLTVNQIDLVASMTPIFGNISNRV